MQKLLNEIKKEIKPEKNVEKEVDLFIKKISKEIRKRKITAKAVTGGSISKGTFLKYDYDVDIFVKFGLKYKKKDISKMLGKILKDFNPVLVHGSRDYYQIKQDFNFEVVPVLDVKKPEQAENVTDMSPMHSVWMKKNIKKLADDIRLAKHFCKANNLYGAESYIRGFSGHVLDILVIYYKGFVNLLRNSQKWRKDQVVDFYNYHKGMAHFNINKSKLSPLVVVDPIDSGRNAAAALNSKKIDEFKKLAKQFLKTPSKKFFEKKKVTIENLKKKAGKGKLLVFNVGAKKGKQDVVGAKLFRSLEYIKRHLVENEFDVSNYGWDWDKKTKALFYFILKNEKLSKNKIWKGPPIDKKEHVVKFKKIYKDNYSKNKVIYARTKRKYNMAEKLILDIAKTEFVSKKIKKIEKMPL
ncbi:nucleotidyltransferase domain-containing protein [Candidatus Woesearchaeota archaeon]|nr:nucleotidyltransferase domain-containing protein [Candidatus Woesearchaeota archaeon]